MSTSTTTDIGPGFEESLRLLQQIVADLEGGSITLDESLQRFEQGVGLLRQCYQFLGQAEQRIEQLVSLDAHGNLTLATFDATSTVEKQSKPAARPARKTPKPKDAPAAEVPPAEITPAGDSPGNLLF